MLHNELQRNVATRSFGVRPTIVMLASVVCTVRITEEIKLPEY